MEKIKNIIRKLNLNVFKIETVPESFSSEVYKIELNKGEKAYLKIPFNENKLYKERAMLERLKTILPVPKVLDYWEGDQSTPGALLLSSIEGEPITGEVSPKIAYEIGYYQAQLHSVDMPGYGVDARDGFNYLEKNDWRLYVKNNFDKWKEPCKEIIEPELYEKCVQHFKREFSSLPKIDGPCVVHMDFRPGNILVKDNKVVGIIDFESACGGSSEIDFTKINRYVWEKYPHTREVFLEGYESVRPIIELQNVIPFYSFYDSFGAVVWCNKRGIEKNRHFLEENIGVLKHIMKGENSDRSY
jgi:Ser/Thr protein kinase RdoA (MazF antagonist)